jgi:hypothetical protein
VLTFAQFSTLHFTGRLTMEFFCSKMKQKCKQMFTKLRVNAPNQTKWNENGK